MTSDFDVVNGGWASKSGPQNMALSYTPDSDDDPLPPYAVADWFTPPHDLALPVGQQEQLLESVAGQDPDATSNGDYWNQPAIGDDAFRDICRRVYRVQKFWWNLDLVRWYVGIKRYRAGQEHVEHQDLHAFGGQLRKVAASIQLSQPSEYEGGDLRIRFAHHDLAAPREAGTLIVMPSWTVHRVTPVTRGERWVCLVVADGPRLR